MRMLLDESLPRRLRARFPGLDVRTVPDVNWAGKSNGELLALASDHFDVFVRADQNLEYQQNLAGYNIAVIVLAALSNRFTDLEPLIDEIRKVLPTARPGRVIRVGGR